MALTISLATNEWYTAEKILFTNAERAAIVPGNGVVPNPEAYEFVMEMTDAGRASELYGKDVFIKIQALEYLYDLYRELSHVP